jgi:hypothetical protein
MEKQIESFTMKAVAPDPEKQEAFLKQINANLEKTQQYYDELVKISCLSVIPEPI